MKPSRPSKGYYGKKPVKEAEGVGGYRLVAEPMQLPHPEPCVECPLRRDAQPGYLGGYTPEMYVQVLHSPALIACHNSPGFHTGEVGKQRQCTGVCAYRANSAVPIAECYKAAVAGVEAIGKDDRFFAQPGEFIAYHKDAQRED